MDGDGSLEQRSLSEKKGFRARWKKSKSRKGNLSRKAKSKKSKWSRSAKSKKSKLSRRAKGGRAKLSGSSKKSKGSSSKSVKSGKSSKDTSKSKSSRLSCLSCKRKKQKDLNSRSSAGSAEYRLFYASLRDEFNKKRVDGPFKQLNPDKQLKDSRSTMGSTNEGVPPICSREPGREDFNRKTEGKISSQDSNSKSDDRSSRSSMESGDKKRKREKCSSSGKKKRKNPLAFLFKRKKERKESKEPSEPESRSASGADDAAGGPAKGSPPSTKSSSQRFSKEGPSSAETDSQKMLKEGTSSVKTKTQKVLRGDRPPTKESDSQKLVKGSPPSAKTDSQRAIRETRRTAKETKSQRLAREGPPPTKSESRNVRECPSSAKTNSQRMEALEKAERDIEKDIMEIAEERRKIWQFWHNAHLVPLTQFLLTVPPLAWAYFALVVCLVVKIIFVCFIFSMLVHSYDAPLVYLMCFMIIHIGSAFATVQVLAVGTKRMVMICGSVDGAVILVSVLLLMFISKDKNGPGIVDVERVGGTTVAVAFLELLLLLNYYHYHFRAPQTREEDPPGLPSIRSYSCTRTSRTTNIPSMSLTQQDLSPRQQPRHPRGHRHHHHRPGHGRVRDISLSGQQDSDMVKTLPPPHYSFLEYSGTDSHRPHRYVRDHRSGEIRDIRHTSV